MAAIFPLISLIYGGFLPAGLLLYSIISTIFSIIQQYLFIGWGGMFPLFGWSRLRRRPHAALPGHPAARLSIPRPGRRPRPWAGAPARPPGRQDHSPQGTRPPGPPRETPLMSAYREFTGKSVEEALKAAREEFGVELNDLDFEILTAGSRGVLGMGAEPARIVAAPRSALGGAAPKREAAASTPLAAGPTARGPRVRRP